MRVHYWLLLSALLLTCLRTVPAQIRIDPSDAAALLSTTSTTPAALACLFVPIPSIVTFNFRNQAGYSIRLPLSQFLGEAHTVKVLTRIAPQDGSAPTYLLRTFDLPAAPHPEFEANLAGYFFLGDGRYQISAVAMDDQHRVCRTEWQLPVSPLFETRVLIPPGEVRTLSDLRPITRSPADPNQEARVTILLNAAPFHNAGAVLTGEQVSLITNSLLALAEQLSTTSLKLIAFNPLNRKIIYRNEDFQESDLEGIEHLLSNLQLGRIDYQALADPRTLPALIETLVDSELQDPHPSKSVIFVGPEGGGGKPAPLTFREPAAPGPRFFYIEYHVDEPPPAPKHATSARAEPQPTPPCQITTTDQGCVAPAAPPSAPPVYANSLTPNSNAPSRHDAIAVAVRKQKGTVFLIRTPSDFAKAIERIAQ